jgi:hypothetical protein
MSDEIMVDDVETETTGDSQQSQGKTFTQEELDRIVADRVARERKKLDRKLDGIDIDEARKLMLEREEAEIERQKERGEFEKVLKQTVEKKEMEIQTYKSKLEQTLVDGSLLTAASKNNAVSPEQVSTLLRNNVKLSSDGQVEVLDADGSVRYNDKGDLLSVDELVNDFLTANPHFVRASVGGAGSKGMAGGSTQKPQSVADMVANWENGGKEAFAALKKAQ